jgi:hypothetical protein
MLDPICGAVHEWNDSRRFGVFGLAFLTSLSIFLNILSCILAGVWWPLFILGFHTLALSSALLFKGTIGFFSTKRMAPVLGPSSIIEQWGDYLTAFFIGSSFGMGQALRHSGCTISNPRQKSTTIV